MITEQHASRHFAHFVTAIILDFTDLSKSARAMADGPCKVESNLVYIKPCGPEFSSHTLEVHSVGNFDKFCIVISMWHKCRGGSLAVNGSHPDKEECSD